MNLSKSKQIGLKVFGIISAWLAGIINLPKFKKIGLIVIGFIVAWLAGMVAVWFKNLGISEAVQLASSGMFAFGDAITFLFAWTVVAIFPTILLFSLIHNNSLFWRITSVGSILLSSTCFFLSLLICIPIKERGSILSSLQDVGILRIFSAPIWFLLFLPGLILCRGTNRKRFLIASALEFGGVCIFIIRMIVISR